MSKSAAILAFKSATLPAVYNWKEDSQPERHPDAETYIALAKDLTEPSLQFAVDVLSRAGYIEPGQENTILERLTTLNRGERLVLDGVSICWRVKGMQACADKILKDSDKSPDDIGDYFGIKFVADDVDDVVRLRTAIVESENMSSRKCEFTLPSQEGFRSHKSHHMVSDGVNRLSIEAMVTHSAFEASDKLTHTLMEYERNILHKQFGAAANKRLAYELTSSVERLRSERTWLNHLSAAAAGLNDLCAPDVLKIFEPAPLKGYARKMLEGLNPALQDQRERIVNEGQSELMRREMA